MSRFSEKVLILAPLHNDAAVAAQVLHDAGLLAEPCSSIDEFCDHLRAGCAVLVVAEEAMVDDAQEKLTNCLDEQPTWSDIPVILLTSGKASNSWQSFSSSGSVTLLERPFGRLTLLRAVDVGLRARRRQYQVRELMEEQLQAARIRDEFFASLSHELRTPLNVILGWTDVLRGGSLPREAQMEALNILERNAQIQKSLIDDLLDTSRIITGKLHIERQPVSLNKILTTLRTSMLLRARQKHQILKLQLPEIECVVVGDEHRLTQVFSNLITNALKFTPDGGQIQISLNPGRDQFMVSVRDNGRGIGPDFLPFVFDRLKQEDMGTTRSQGGLGLGLAISAHIVEQHGGKIEADSEGRGHGSEFTVTLPAALHNIRSADVVPIFRTADLAKKKILVVDDSPDILTLIELWLANTHADIRLVNNAQEVLDLISDFEPDILVSDIGMPGMDGYQLIREIRQHENKNVRNVFAIALTAYAKDDERERALSAGFHLHISKPISSQQLLRAVSSLEV